MKIKQNKYNIMKKFLLLVIGFMALAMGVNAKPYTHVFSDKELTTNGGTVTLSEIAWSASNAKIISFDNKNSRGVQIGSSKGVCTNYSLTTNAFADYTINSVTVYSCIANGGDAKMTIKVGNQTSQQYTLSSSKDDYYQFTCSEKGDITISWNATLDKAYYLAKIVIEYTIPADQMDLEEPVFTTSPELIYADKVTAYAQTEDQGLEIYYTLDGTIPSYEDYNQDPRVGTTHSSRGWQMGANLTDSCTVNTIKAMAVMVEGDIVYKSDVVEAQFVVSTTKPYVHAAEITEGKRYAFVANDSIADALIPGKDKGFLQDRKVAKSEKYLESVEYNAFIFTAVDGGYTIQDATERYIYIDGTANEFSFAKEKPANGAVWSIAFKDGKAEIKNGNNTIYYVKNEGKFGCFAAADANMELPELYMLREYPQATITPGNNSEVKGLQELTITCEDGISFSNNLKLKAIANQYKDEDGVMRYEIDATYKCEQVDANTLKFTIEKPLVSQNNAELKLIIEGDIFLSPEIFNYPIPIIDRYERCICSYKHLGIAEAAEITSVIPSNNEKIQVLEYILFTFTNTCAVNEDNPKNAKLYREGDSANLIAFGYTTNNVKGTGKVSHYQGALKITEPIEKEGTYILEVEDGYFKDRNGYEVKGSTIKIVVDKNGKTRDELFPTAIEDVVAENNNGWTVYNLNGIKVLETTDANELNNLNKGIYIINNKKVFIK